MQWKNKIKLAVMAVAVLLLKLPATAQRVDVQEFPRAMVILNEGDTLTGSLSYHREEDLIRLKQEDGTVSTFSAVNVAEFTVADLGRNRNFRTYLWNRGNDYSDFRTPAFFEQLSSGAYSVVKRETVTRRDVSRDPYYRGGFGYDPYGRTMGPMWRYELRELFYLLTPEGKIVTLRNPKKDVLRVFSPKAKQIQDYVKQNQLDYRERQDLVRIVNFYNSLL